MFDNFTFAAQQTRPIQHEVSASPTDTSFNSTATGQKRISTSSIESLAEPAINNVDRLTDSSLHPPYRNTQARVVTTPPLIPDDDSDEPEDYTVSYISTRLGMTHVVQTPSGPVPSTTTSCPPTHTGCKRLQRQLNTQLQCCPSHVRDIKSLVDNMIETNSQCRLHSPPSNSNLNHTTQSSLPPTDSITGSSIDHLGIDEGMSEGDGFVNASTNVSIDPYEDEGFAEMEDEEPIIEISLRRASTPIGIRKYTCAPFVVKYSDAGSNHPLPRERHKIRCVPRIRKRVSSTPAAATTGV